MTRAGILEYADKKYPGGIRRELRPESEVFDSRSMESAANLPITHDHPPKMLTAATAKPYMVGATGDRVTRDDNFLKGKVMVANAPTIAKMDSGDNDVSLGYVCIVDETPGVDPKYGRYDAVQRNIRYNHLAVAIGKGDARATGSSVRMDSRELSDTEFDAAVADILLTQRGDAAKQFGVATSVGGRFDARVTFKGVAAMADEKLMESMRALEAGLKAAELERDQHKERADSVTRERDIATGKLGTIERERDEAKAALAAHSTSVESATVAKERERADKAEQLVARFDSTRDMLVRQRAALLNTGTIVMGPEFRMDDLSDRDIKVQVVKRLDSSAEVGKDVAEGVIEGMFQALTAGHLKNARSMARISEAARAGDVDAASTTRTDSLDEKRKHNREAWKRPLPNDPRARKEA